MHRIVTTALIAAAAGCTTFELRVEQFQGDITQSYRTRLARARGMLEEAVSASLADPELARRLGATGDGGAQQPTVAGHLDRASAVFDLIPASGDRPTITGGLPRPSDAKGSEAHNEDVRRRLSVVEKELVQAGQFLAALTPDAVPGAMPHSVRAASATGAEMLDILRFPDFAEASDPGNEDLWRCINPVDATSAFGDSSYVIVQDAVGNWQIREFSFDPQESVNAMGSVASSMLRVGALSLGVPLPPKDGDPDLDADGTADAMNAAAREAEAATRGRRRLDRTLRADLEAILATLPAAGTAAGGQPAAAGALQTARDRIAAYNRRIPAGTADDGSAPAEDE